MLVGGNNVESNRIPFVTVLLIVINIGVFIKSYSLECMAAREAQHHMAESYFSSNSDSLIRLPAVKELVAFYEDWGFSLKDITERGEYASVVTHMFVHGGLLHIIGNLVILWGFGVALEDALGGLPYGCFYMLCGLAAAFAQAFVCIESDLPCIGASGAIAGVMGGFFILFGAQARVKLLLWIGCLPNVIEVPALVFGGFWILQQVIGLLTTSAEAGGVAWMAHLGGVAAGTVVK